MHARKAIPPAALPSAETIDIEKLSRLCSSGEVDIVVVLGPTACGKTRYAVELAKRLGKAEIISADSRQVYRGMDIGTGKDLEEYGDIPYHLIDIVPAGYSYNVYEYQKDFRKAYAEILQRGSIPILCGGTGMYISAVTQNYNFKDKRPLSSVKTVETVEGLPSKAFFIGILASREERNEKIDRRLDARLEEGMIAEVQTLLDNGVSEEKLLSYGLEYKFVTLYLLGELSFEQMREKLAIAIHQFAKRQMTWFRGMERSGVKIFWTEGV